MARARARQAGPRAKPRAKPELRDGGSNIGGGLKGRKLELRGSRWLEGCGKVAVSYGARRWGSQSYSRALGLDLLGEGVRLGTTRRSHEEAVAEEAPNGGPLQATQPKSRHARPGSATRSSRNKGRPRKSARAKGADNSFAPEHHSVRVCQAGDRDRSCPMATSSRELCPQEKSASH